MENIFLSDVNINDYTRLKKNLESLKNFSTFYSPLEIKNISFPILPNLNPYMFDKEILEEKPNCEIFVGR